MHHIQLGFRSKMSFYRITDPKKRDEIVMGYLATMKRLKERDIEQRIGNILHQRNIVEAAAPIIESNEKTSNVLTNELKPIKTEIENLNENLNSRKLSIARKRKIPEEDLRLKDYLEGDHSRQDMYFGIQKVQEGGYVLGNKKIEITDNIIIIPEEGTKYPLTQGLLSLIMDISPTNYTEEDYNQYTKLVLQTDLINNPTGLQSNSKPNMTKKYRDYLVKITEANVPHIVEKSGQGIQFLPSSIKELKEMFNLLLAEFIAGNTATRTELVAVLDQLLKRHQITEEEYTTVNTLLSSKK